MPAVSGSVSVAVAVSSWASPGQVIFVSNAGYFSVNSVPDSTHLSLINLGYSGNAAPTTVIGGSQTVSPGGLQGPTGASGANTLNDISPTTTKGDLIVDDGANNPLSSDTRLAKGTDKYVLTADSSQALGLDYKPVDVSGNNTSIIGVSPISNGGTGQVRPCALQGAVKKLVVATIPSGTFASRSQVAISADQAAVMKADGNFFLASGVAATLDISGTVGSPLGLDTGSVAISTWYYIWLIYNPAGPTVSAVFSASGSAPTLSSGTLTPFTYTALLGQIYRDSSGNFQRMIQYGNRVAIQESVALASGTAGSTATTPYAFVDISAIIPPNAITASGTMGVSVETTAPWGISIGSDADMLVGRMTFNGGGTGGVALNSFLDAVPFTDLMLSANPKEIHYLMQNTAAQYRMTINGYTFQ